MLKYEAFSTQVADLLDIKGERPLNRYLGLYDELGFDSLQSFQLLLLVESMAGLDVPEEDPPGLFTLDDAYQYYVKLCCSLDVDGDAAGM
jgi:acyl carrier protein